MKRRLIPIAAVTAALLLGASCSDDDTVSSGAESDEGGGGATQTSAPEGPAEEASDETQPLDPYGGAPPADDGSESSGGGAAEVSASGFAFAPATIEVAAGTTVKWTNGDTVPHTVTAGEPGSPSGDFDEDLAAGTSAEITFDEPGTFTYFCEVHPNMTGEVVVS